MKKTLPFVLSLVAASVFAADLPRNLNQRDARGRTPLLLTFTDIDVNHVNNLGWTALLEAVILGDGERATARSSVCCSTTAPTPTSPTAPASRRCSMPGREASSRS